MDYLADAGGDAAGELVCSICALVLNMARKNGQPLDVEKCDIKHE